MRIEDPEKLILGVDFSVESDLQVEHNHILHLELEYIGKRSLKGPCIALHTTSKGPIQPYITPEGHYIVLHGLKKRALLSLCSLFRGPMFRLNVLKSLI